MKKTLSQIEAGKKALIVDFATYGRGSIPHYIIRLQEMGILKGESILVIRNTGIGPIEIAVKGTHLALGRGIASKIIVEEVRE